MQNFTSLELECLALLLNRSPISRKSLLTQLACTENQLNFMVKKLESKGLVTRIKLGVTYNLTDISISNRAKVTELFSRLIDLSGLHLPPFDDTIACEEVSDDQDFGDAIQQETSEEISDLLVEWLQDHDIELDPTEIGKISDTVAKKVDKIYRKKRK